MVTGYNGLVGVLVLLCLVVLLNIQLEVVIAKPRIVTSQNTYFINKQDYCGLNPPDWPRQEDPIPPTNTNIYQRTTSSTTSSKQPPVLPPIPQLTSAVRLYKPRLTDSYVFIRHGDRATITKGGCFERELGVVREVAKSVGLSPEKSTDDDINNVNADAILRMPITNIRQQPKIEFKRVNDFEKLNVVDDDQINNNNKGDNIKDNNKPHYDDQLLALIEDTFNPQDEYLKEIIMQKSDDGVKEIANNNNLLNQQHINNNTNSMDNKTVDAIKDNNNVMNTMNVLQMINIINNNIKGKYDKGVVIDNDNKYDKWLNSCPSPSIMQVPLEHSVDSSISQHKDINNTLNNITNDDNQHQQHNYRLYDIPFAPIPTYQRRTTADASFQGITPYNNFFHPMQNPNKLNNNANNANDNNGPTEEGWCGNGQLTQKGLMQGYYQGQVLARYFDDVYNQTTQFFGSTTAIAEDQLFPRHDITEENFVFRSTDVPRTKETMVSVVTGLFDQLFWVKNNPKNIPPVGVVDGQVDAMALGRNMCDMAPYLQQVYKNKTYTEMRPAMSEIFNSAKMLLEQHTIDRVLERLVKVNPAFNNFLTITTNQKEYQHNNNNNNNNDKNYELWSKIKDIVQTSAKGIFNDMSIEDLFDCIKTTQCHSGEKLPKGFDDEPIFWDDKWKLITMSTLLDVNNANNINKTNIIAGGGTLAEELELRIHQFWQLVFNHNHQLSSQVISGPALIELTPMFIHSALKQPTEHPTIYITTGHDLGMVMNFYSVFINELMIEPDDDDEYTTTKTSSIDFFNNFVIARQQNKPRKYIPRGYWPMYGSNIHIEFYKTQFAITTTRKVQQNQHQNTSSIPTTITYRSTSFMRFLWLGKVAIPHFCKDEIIEGELCPTFVVLEYLKTRIPQNNPPPPPKGSEESPIKPHCPRYPHYDFKALKSQFFEDDNGNNSNIVNNVNVKLTKTSAGTSINANNSILRTLNRQEPHLVDAIEDLYDVLITNLQVPTKPGSSSSNGDGDEDSSDIDLQRPEPTGPTHGTKMGEEDIYGYNLAWPTNVPAD